MAKQRFLCFRSKTPLALLVIYTTCMYTASTPNLRYIGRWQPSCSSSARIDAMYVDEILSRRILWSRSIRTSHVPACMLNRSTLCSRRITFVCPHHGLVKALRTEPLFCPAIRSSSSESHGQEERRARSEFKKCVISLSSVCLCWLNHSIRLL